MRHLAWVGRAVYAGSEVGDWIEIDVGDFVVDYCDLVRAVWDEVPVVWANGVARSRPPPSRHRCAPCGSLPGGSE